jgi:hypothetical protein
MQKKLFVFGGLLGLAIQYMTLLAVLAAAISSWQWYFGGNLPSSMQHISSISTVDNYLLSFLITKWFNAGSLNNRSISISIISRISCLICK